ncbi:MAG: hypothetical protein LBE31_12095 [Deltaproteobacteria bacterium]|jgi:hypothetical protein|nr:hypothetical protein [Deltaproteobacteria bacterium]
MTSPIGDSKFILNLKGVKGVILFPALGTPAILKQGDPLTVILAADESSYKLLEKDGVIKPGLRLRISLALKFYTQLLLRPWDSYDGLSDYHGYLQRLKNTALVRNNLYGSRDSAVKRFEAGDFYGFYLGTIDEGLNEDGDIPVNLYRPGSINQEPFGVLHSSAASMYREAGYRWLFQLTFKTDNLTPVVQNTVMELVFLYLDWQLRNEGKVVKTLKPAMGSDNEAFRSKNNMLSDNREPIREAADYLENPGDELLLEIFDREVNKGDGSRGDEGDDAKELKGLLRPIAKNLVPTLKESSKEIFFFRLFNPEPREFNLREPSQNPRDAAKGVPGDAARAQPKRLSYISSSDGLFLASRHPVYFTNKNYLDIGTIADTHFNSRQALSKLVAPQMIEGAPISDSPFLGAISREAILPTLRLMKNLGAKSDVLLWSYDLYDFVKSIKPDEVVIAASGSDAKTPVRRTSDLWRYLKFSDNVNSYSLYPGYIDAVMALSMVHSHYKNIQKPLALVAGSLKARDNHYGNLRLINKSRIKTNASIAIDNNLTFYEAALLFGREFQDTYLLNKQNNLKQRANFPNDENLKWFYQTVTPWKDALISIGDRQNLLLLGSGGSQDSAQSKATLGAGAPQADKAITIDQLSLARAAAKKIGAINIMASHFSEASNEISELIETKEEVKKEKIHFTICGHTHRCGAYVHESLGQAANAGSQLSSLDGLRSDNKLGLRSVNLKNNFRSVSLVCGSAGSYSSQNLDRSPNIQEGANYDLEPSQGLLLIFDNQSQAQKVIFKRDSQGRQGSYDISVKPRLAVRLDYLWYESPEGGGSPFATKQIGNSRFSTGTSNQSYDIVADNLDSWFVFKINPRWASFFYPHGHSDGLEIPLSAFTLYAVHQQGLAKTQSLGPMEVHEYREDQFRLNAKGRDLKNFINKLNLLDYYFDNWLFFFSVALKDINNLKEQYNIESPWCWPVAVDFVNYQYFNRPFGDRWELPDFDKLKKIYEYS